MWNEIGRRVTAWGANPRIVLIAALTIAIVSMAACVLFMEDIYRDVANVYAYVAREFGRGNWAGAHQPRLPQLNIALAGTLCRLGFEAYTATIVISGLFFVLTVYPLYLLLMRFVSPIGAAWGALLYVLAPKMIRFAGSGLLEAGRNLFIVLGLLFLFRLLEAKKWRDAVWFGLSIGGLTLSRGEGLAVAIVLLAAFGLGWCAWKKLPFGRGVALGVIAAGVWLATLSPVTYWNYRMTGYASPDHRIVEFFYPELKAPKPAHLAELPETLWERVEDMLSGLLRGAYEPYFFLALFGVLLAVACRRWRMEYNLLVVLVLLHCLMYFSVVSAYRYYTVVIPLMMVFTVMALGAIVRYMGRYPKLAWLLPLVFLVMAPLQLANGLELLLSPEGEALRRVAAVVAGQRDELAPAGERLRVAAAGLPEITFLSDSVAANGYGNRVEDWSVFQEFDLICVEADDERVLPVVLTRGDLEEISHPDQGEVRIFRKLKPRSE